MGGCSVGPRVNVNEIVTIQKPKFCYTKKMVWRYGGYPTFPQNLALIRFIISEKMRIDDDGRRNAHATALAMLTVEQN